MPEPYLEHHGRLRWKFENATCTRVDLPGPRSKFRSPCKRNVGEGLAICCLVISRPLRCRYSWKLWELSVPMQPLFLWHSRILSCFSWNLIWEMYLVDRLGKWWVFNPEISKVSLGAQKKLTFFERIFVNTYFMISFWALKTTKNYFYATKTQTSVAKKRKIP